MSRFIRQSTYFVVSLFALPLLAGGQAHLNGPVAGLHFDSESHSIRAILGVPGAAYLGAPLVAAVDLASVSPDGKSAVVVKDGSVHLVSGLDRESPAWRLLEESAAGLHQIVWNAESSAVLLAGSDGGNVRVWRNLRGEEAPSVTVLGAFSGAAILALDTSGECAAARMVAGESEGLYLIQAQSAPRLILDAGHVSGVAFTNGGRDLLIADQSNHQVLEVQAFREGSGASLIAGEAMGVSEPAGVAASSDGRRIFVAGKSNKTLLVIDRAAGVLTNLALDFDPSRIAPLPGGSLFLLNTPAAGHPLQVLKADENVQVYFVPAGPAVSEEE